MTNVGSLEPSRETAKPERLGWKELYLKEDWWAVWLGFALMVLSILLFQAGSSNIFRGWESILPARRYAIGSNKEPNG